MIEINEIPIYEVQLVKSIGKNQPCLMKILPDRIEMYFEKIKDNITLSMQDIKLQYVKEGQLRLNKKIIIEAPQQPLNLISQIYQDILLQQDQSTIDTYELKSEQTGNQYQLQVNGQTGLVLFEYSNDQAVQNQLFKLNLLALNQIVYNDNCIQFNYNYNKIQQQYLFICDQTEQIIQSLQFAFKQLQVKIEYVNDQQLKINRHKIIDGNVYNITLLYQTQTAPDGISADVIPISQKEYNITIGINKLIFVSVKQENQKAEYSFEIPLEFITNVVVLEQKIKISSLSQNIYIECLDGMIDDLLAKIILRVGQVKVSWCDYSNQCRINYQPICMTMQMNQRLQKQLQQGNQPFSTLAMLITSLPQCLPLVSKDSGLINMLVQCPSQGAQIDLYILLATSRTLFIQLGQKYSEWLTGFVNQLTNFQAFALIRTTLSFMFVPYEIDVGKSYLGQNMVTSLNINSKKQLFTQYQIQIFATEQIQQGGSLSTIGIHSDYQQGNNYMKSRIQAEKDNRNYFMQNDALAQYTEIHAYNTLSVADQVNMDQVLLLGILSDLILTKSHIEQKYFQDMIKKSSLQVIEKQPTWRQMALRIVSDNIYQLDKISLFQELPVYYTSSGIINQLLIEQSNLNTADFVQYELSSSLVIKRCVSLFDQTLQPSLKQMFFNLLSMEMINSRDMMIFMMKLLTNEQFDKIRLANKELQQQIVTKQISILLPQYSESFNEFNSDIYSLTQIWDSNIRQAVYVQLINMLNEYEQAREVAKRTGKITQLNWSELQINTAGYSNSPMNKLDIDVGGIVLSQIIDKAQELQTILNNHELCNIINKFIYYQQKTNWMTEQEVNESTDFYNEYASEIQQFQEAQNNFIQQVQIDTNKLVQKLINKIAQSSDIKTITGCIYCIHLLLYASQQPIDEKMYQVLLNMATNAVKARSFSQQYYWLRLIQFVSYNVNKSDVVKSNYYKILGKSELVEELVKQNLLNYAFMTKQQLQKQIDSDIGLYENINQSNIIELAVDIIEHAIQISQPPQNIIIIPQPRLIKMFSSCCFVQILSLVLMKNCQLDDEQSAKLYRRFIKMIINLSSQKQFKQKIIQNGLQFFILYNSFDVQSNENLIQLLRILLQDQEVMEQFQNLLPDQVIYQIKNNQCFTVEKLLFQPSFSPILVFTKQNMQQIRGQIKFYQDQLYNQISQILKDNPNVLTDTADIQLQSETPILNIQKIQIQKQLFQPQQNLEGYEVKGCYVNLFNFDEYKKYSNQDYNKYQDMLKQTKQFMTLKQGVEICLSIIQIESIQDLFDYYLQNPTIQFNLQQIVPMYILDALKEISESIITKYNLLLQQIDTQLNDIQQLQQAQQDFENEEQQLQQFYYNCLTVALVLKAVQQYAEQIMRISIKQQNIVQQCLDIIQQIKQVNISKKLSGYKDVRMYNTVDKLYKQIQTDNFDNQQQQTTYFELLGQQYKNRLNSPSSVSQDQIQKLEQNLLDSLKTGCLAQPSLSFINSISQYLNDTQTVQFLIKLIQLLSQQWIYQFSNVQNQFILQLIKLCLIDQSQQLLQLLLIILSQSQQSQIEIAKILGQFVTQSLLHQNKNLKNTNQFLFQDHYEINGTWNKQMRQEIVKLINENNSESNQQIYQIVEQQILQDHIIIENYDLTNVYKLIQVKQFNINKIQNKDKLIILVQQQIIQLCQQQTFQKAFNLYIIILMTIMQQQKVVVQLELTNQLLITYQNKYLSQEQEQSVLFIIQQSDLQQVDKEQLFVFSQVIYGELLQNQEEQQNKYQLQVLIQIALIQNQVQIFILNLLLKQIQNKQYVIALNQLLFNGDFMNNLIPSKLIVYIKELNYVDIVKFLQGNDSEQPCYNYDLQMNQSYTQFIDQLAQQVYSQQLQNEQIKQQYWLQNCQYSAYICGNIDLQQLQQYLSQNKEIQFDCLQVILQIIQNINQSNSIISIEIISQIFVQKNQLVYQLLSDKQILLFIQNLLYDQQTYMNYIQPCVQDQSQVTQICEKIFQIYDQLDIYELSQIDGMQVLIENCCKWINVVINQQTEQISEQTISYFNWLSLQVDQNKIITQTLQIIERISKNSKYTNQITQIIPMDLLFNYLFQIYNAQDLKLVLSLINNLSLNNQQNRNYYQQLIQQYQEQFNQLVQNNQFQLNSNQMVIVQIQPQNIQDTQTIKNNNQCKQEKLIQISDIEVMFNQIEQMI